LSFLNWTGNPFVDSGIAAILEHCRKKAPEEIDVDDLSKMSMLLRQVYVTAQWKKAFHSIFTGNCKLLQNAYKTDERRHKEFFGLLDQLLAGVEIAGETGDCIACGRRDRHKRKTKTDIPLTGSGKSRGFFSYAVAGADYCETCAFATQCSPLTYYACGKLAMLHSTSPKIMRYWAKRPLANIYEQMARDEFTGCFNEGYTNPQNALFHIAQNLVLEHREQWGKEYATIRLYHFTNYLQGPELDIYDLPTPVFCFLFEVQSHSRLKDWQAIVRRGYYFLDKKNHKQITYPTDGKSEDDYKNKDNRVYVNLLAGKSILPYFLNIQTRTAYGDYSLLTVYIKEILAMDEKRIDTVKRVADEIARFIQQSPKGKTRLQNLEGADKLHEFCNVLRHISRERIALRPQEPLFTLDEFAQQLFPEGALTFRETRYLILFRLYEQLHDWLVAEGLAEDQTDDVTLGTDDSELAIG